MADKATQASPQGAGGTVTALARGIQVLRCFSPASGSLSNTELSAQTGIPRPTVTRLATTLVGLGMLRQDPATERFSLGAGVVPLANAFLAQVDVRAVARPHMAALAERFEGAVYLAVPDEGAMVLVEIARSRTASLRSNHEIGARIDLVDSALGRAYLCALAERDPPAHARQLGARRGLTGVLQQAHQDFAAHGLCLSLGEVAPLIHSVAVPLVGARGELLALNFGAPAVSTPERLLRETIGPALRAVAAQVQHEIGSA